MHLASEVEMSDTWTEPGAVKCHFCKEPDSGYALKDEVSEWQPACWTCVKKHTDRKPQVDSKKILLKKEDKDGQSV